MNNGDCEMKFIETRLQLANIFTKPFPKDRFFFLRNELGILDSQTFSSICFYLFLILFVKTNMGEYGLCVILKLL